tara:strand:+ start:393 stop:1463 length:1071 start_codon:yes stop_codon:yes gene_type:complete
MALWGNKDNITATGRVTLDYQTGIVTGSNLEDPGNGTQFGETGEISEGDIIRFGVIDKPGVYMGDAVVVSIAGTTSLTIGSTMGLDGVAIARTTFTVTQAPKSTVLDRSFSEDDNINDGSPNIVNELIKTADSATATTGVGASIIDVKTTLFSTAGVQVGDFLENDGNNIKIIGVGTATFHANFNSGVGSDRIFVDGIVPGLDFDTVLLNNGVFHGVAAIGATFVEISPVLATGIATNGVVLMNSRIDQVFNHDHHFVIGLESDITAAISAGDALQIKRHKGGYSRNVYGVGKTGVEDAEVDGSGAGLYATSAGWVGVTTYVDTDGNLRVKKEVLVAMSGISTGNAPSYPNIENAN